MKDESHRNQWPMGRVVETIKSKDNHVRKVKLMVIKDGVKKIYFRPLKDLILLMRAKVIPHQMTILARPMVLSEECRETICK